MSMARAKGLLTVDEEDSLRENNPSLLNRNSRMCPVPPQGVLKGLNTSSAAAILRDTPETNQMTTERKEGRFRREVGSQLFRRMTRARFASLLGIRNPPPRPAPPGLVTKLRPSPPPPLQPCIKEESSVQSSSPEVPMPRARARVHPKRSSRSPTTSYPGRGALNSTVKRVLTENPQYVARFLVYRLHSQPSIDSGFS